MKCLRKSVAVDDGFILTAKRWRPSPAYDMNPIPLSTGLSLNISEHSNALDLDVAREGAEKFRVGKTNLEVIIEKVPNAVSEWHTITLRIGIARREM